MTAASQREVCSAIVGVYQELSRLGLNVAAAGNMSARFGAGMLITPTGCTAETLKPSHIVATGFDGSSTGKLEPSSNEFVAKYPLSPDGGEVRHIVEGINEVWLPESALSRIMLIRRGSTGLY